MAGVPAEVVAALVAVTAAFFNRSQAGLTIALSQRVQRVGVTSVKANSQQVLEPAA